MGVEYLDGQMEVTKGYIAYFHARIVSGAYKERVGHVFHGTLGENPFTEEEVLQDEIETMHRHIKRLKELIDAKEKILNPPEDDYSF